MALVMLAANARIGQGAVQIGFGNFLHVARAAANHHNVLRVEHVECAVAHIAGEHRVHAHLPQSEGDVALATAAFGRRNGFDTSNLLVFNCIDGVFLAVSEMVINAAIACGDCYFHCFMF